jgi:glycosyltransferase involved in cell wall biosynthesis
MPGAMDGSERRLVVISPGIPHESRGASTVLFYHYIAGLRRSGFRIMNVLLLQPDNSTEEGLAEYEKQMADGERFTVVPCRTNSFVVWKRLGFRLNTAAVGAAISRAEGFQPDAVLCFDLLSAWVGARIDRGAKIAWLGDLRFQTEWYHTWYGIKESWSSVRDLPLTLLRCHLWRRHYREVLRRMDSAIVSARISQEHLRRIGIAAAYLPYPWPDAAPGGDKPSVERPGMPTFLFLGTLTGLGSRSAFHFMLDAVYPEAVRLWGKKGFRILIAGARGLPGWVERELGERPELKYLGFVEDIVRVMRTCHAVLVPIEVPVGNRSRILTALAAGVPVVAHENAALGNPDLVDGATCYLAGDGWSFIERMQRTVERSEEVARIVRQGRVCYEAHFAPEAATGMMLAEVERVIAERQRA